MTALRKPIMSRDEFFVWAEAQNERFEFDGFEPVAMTGGLINHSRIIGNVQFALRTHLRGGRCEMMGPDAGLATVGNAVRYPDAIVACGDTDGRSRVVQDAVVVFEVLSPSSGRIDRMEKAMEYRGVSSIRRYVILDYLAAQVTVLARDAAGDDWTRSVLADGDVLQMPEIGIEMPIAEFYDRIEF